MPHKHKRREADEKNFDLAPNRIAKPLPTYVQSEKSWRKDKKQPEKSPKRKRNNASSTYKEDDTPRAFARLMHLSSGQKLPSGLDEGESRSKKKKRKVDKVATKNDTGNAESTKTTAANGEQLKILPGERLGDFSARVNQALPVAGLSKKGKAVEGVKERQTKTEKRLHKMYAEWREEEARRKEKLEEFQEEQEEQDDEKETELGGQSVHFKSTGRKSRRRRMVGEVEDDDEDPWAVLKTKREAPKGLHDVVQAPPTIQVVPKEKFKVRNGATVNIANVPSTAGSLKRREELGEARKEVIERYRALMKGGGRL